jgi:hypothetical protein
MYIRDLLNQAIQNKAFGEKNQEDFLELMEILEINPPTFKYKGKTHLDMKKSLELVAKKIKSMDIIERCEVLMGIDTITPIQKHVLKQMKDNYMSCICIGKGGGKDFMSALLLIDEIIDILFNPLAFERIDLMNIAPNADLANNVFFKEFKVWFKKNRVFNIIGIGENKGNSKAPIQLAKTFLDVGPAITVHSGNSTSASFEGKNLKCVVVDEISDENFKNAEKMFYQAKSSVQTRFGYNGKVVAITWNRFPTPNPLDDVGYKIMMENQGIDNIFTFKGKTWEVNSRRVKEDFKDDYERNEILAKKMYECEPPDLNAYFISLDALNARKKDGVSLFNWQPVYDEKEGKLSLNFKQKRDINKTLYIHTDLSINHDRTAIAISYFEKGKVIVSDLIILEPTVGYRVDYTSLEKFYKFLQERLNVRLSFDQFNSEYFIQKFGGERISKRVDVWTVFQELVEGQKEITLIDASKKKKGKIEFYQNGDIWEKLKLQILQHQVNSNKVVYFGERSPDHADAVVSSVYNCSINSTYEIDEEDALETQIKPLQNEKIVFKSLF